MARRFRLESCRLVDANERIAAWHRHSGPVLIAQESVQAVDRASGAIVGVGVLGLPLSSTFTDGTTLEIRRTATDGTPHACSAIMGALCRAAERRRALRVITYTREGESGASLRAAGFTLDMSAHRDFLVTATAIVPIIVPLRPRSWASPSRPNRTIASGEGRFRWQRILPLGLTEDGVITLGEAAGRAGQRIDTNPFSNDDTVRWSLWREAWSYSSRPAA